jgi:hypothetical protein
LATARRVARKMGRRLSRGRGIGYVSIRYAPSSRLADGPF